MVIIYNTVSFQITDESRKATIYLESVIRYPLVIKL